MPPANPKRPESVVMTGNCVDGVGKCVWLSGDTLEGQLEEQ